MPPADPDQEKGPLRRCIVTRETLPKEAMLRFVASPEGVVTPDVAGRLPGRGFWLSCTPGLLEQAIKKGAFPRAAKAQLRVPAELPAQVTELLRARLADSLGLARRAGQAVAGFQKVREALAGGRVALLLEAADGSPAERARLLGGHTPPVVLALQAEVLGRVFGRDIAAHVAVLKGRLAEVIAQDARRLSGLGIPA